MGLQLEVEHIRNTLHRIFHYLLANQDSRDSCLNYIQTVLKRNEKRAQLAMEERQLAGDGFMLNLLSVLQNLSLKIKFNKMDMMYPFHPNTVIVIQNETRLKFSSQEVADWLQEFSKFTIKLTEFCDFTLFIHNFQTNHTNSIHLIFPPPVGS